jgi:hypothetical protein
MLTQLLNEIRAGGTFHPAILAKRLGVGVDLVEVMLEDLERRGLLVQVSLDCDQPCGGCPLVDGCGSKNTKARLWHLSPLKEARN